MPSRLSTQRAEPTLHAVTDRGVERWLSQIPIDLWWRRKYRVAYGSPRHRAMSFFDQLREYREEVLLKRIAQEQSERDAMGDDYDARVVKQSQEEIDEDYENINLDDF